LWAFCFDPASDYRQDISPINNLRNIKTWLPRYDCIAKTLHKIKICWLICGGLIL